MIKIKVLFFLMINKGAIKTLCNFLRKSVLLINQNQLNHVFLKAFLDKGFAQCNH